MRKADPLIRTKLHIPFTRPGLISRERLQDQICHGLHFPLTLITAPAGFGKTTLIAASIPSCGMQAAWLSLDATDNQPGNFLRYLLAALQEVEKTIGGEASQEMKVAPQTAPVVILTSIINDLETSGRETALVLDDYHQISSPSVHEQVTFLLEHCPKTFHLVIVTRADPPLPLSRLRARGQIVELRGADLRFTASEAELFLNDVMGLSLDEGSIAALAARTEGWITGLQMAALSMRDRPDKLAFIQGFSGTNRYIMDFLLEEVLASQPPEIQRFLLCTSILERMTASLCDAVLFHEEEQEGKDAADSRPEASISSRSASILENLERANLFLIPLDDKRTWYRYHRLFADLLYKQLQSSRSEKEVAQLHLRASEWFEKEGLIVESIHYASRTSDDRRVERLIEENYMEMVNRGEMSWVRFWMGELSKEQVYKRPWLCIYEAYSHAWFGELDEAELFLQEAEQRIQSEKSKNAAHPQLAHLAYVRSRVTGMRGDIGRAIAYCIEARNIVPAGDLALQLDIGTTLGYEYFLNGDFSEADQILMETIHAGITAGSIINPAAGYCVLARMYAVQGRLKRSFETYQIAEKWIPADSHQHYGARAVVEIGTADLLYEWNDLDAALARLHSGLDLMPSWGKADDMALAYTTLSRIHLAWGDLAAAGKAIEKANQLIRDSGVFPEARNAVETAQVKFWLAQGALQAAANWAVSCCESVNDSNSPIQFIDELPQITRARVLLAQNSLDDAVRLLTRLKEAARSGGRSGRLVEIMILEALALQKMGDAAQAYLALQESLALAEPGGYIRAFQDEGFPMQALLAGWLTENSDHALRNYAAHLLSQLDIETQTRSAARARTSPAGDLVEPLSQRELEVLSLIALGKTNSEIASQLVVARGTVKAHAASIYRKLDVKNRTEAVARARKLGLLSY